MKIKEKLQETKEGLLSWITSFSPKILAIKYLFLQRIYKKSICIFIIKTRDCGVDKKIRTRTLLSMIEENCSDHIEKLGLGQNFCQLNNVAWVLSKSFVQIFKYPGIGSQIKISSINADANKFCVFKEIIITGKNKEILAKASMQWTLINVITRRPQEIAALVKIITFGEKNSIPKIKLPEQFEKEKLKLIVAKYHLDINNHVNNTWYPVWAIQSMDNCPQGNNRPSIINIQYKGETLFGDTVIIDKSIEDATSYHTIKDNDDKIKTIIKIKW